MARKKSSHPPADEGPKRQADARTDPEAASPEIQGKSEPIPPKSPSSSKSKDKAKRGKKPAIGSRPDDINLAKARLLAIQSSESLDPKRRLALAKQAIEMSADCAEGYLLLADLAKTRKQALEYYAQAVDASARVLGPEIFRDQVGNFWGIFETRLYMRARLSLAEALWASGRRIEAADHLDEMLKLNPFDNQGLRYILAAWLLFLDRLDDLDRLLQKFDETSATWSYTKALVSFRRTGDSPESRKLLTASKKSNKHVPSYLLGITPLPPEQPPFYSPGDEDDAILYVGHHLAAWKAVPGSLAWVRSRLKPTRKKRSKPPSIQGPSRAVEERLKRLPSEMDAWQADFRQFARRVEIAGERVRPWMVLISSRTNDLVLAHSLTEEAPSAGQLWDIVAEAMERPAAGDPHRPTEIQVRPGTPWEELTDNFDAIGVSFSPVETLDQVDFLFDDLARHMAGVDPPGLLDMPGVTPEQVGRFFEAAAEFYRRAPWRLLGYEAVIRVECDRYQSGPWFAVIMGQSGLTLGLALYEDLSLLRKMWAGKLSDEEGARRTVALTVTFDDDSTIAEVDLEAIEKYGWPLASPDAYPSVFRKERGLMMRPPLSWEIDLMDACLRALPDFVARRKPDDTTRELVPVPGTGDGSPLELGLCWIEETY
jgi:tetratricopeptide (TPR) repeat protein